MALSSPQPPTLNSKWYHFVSTLAPDFYSKERKKGPLFRKLQIRHTDFILWFSSEDENAKWVTEWIQRLSRNEIWEEIPHSIFFLSPV